MRLGITHKGLLPKDFWALTPAELMLVFGVSGDANLAMARDRLEELSQQWPDHAQPKESMDGTD